MKKVIFILLGIMLNSVDLKSQSSESVYVDVLKAILKTEKQWVKVHAAEFLLWTGNNSSLVYQTYLDEEKNFDSMVPYRIGIWRVLYQASNNAEEKKKYLNKILDAYHTGQDKLHALETLAKLKFSLARVDSQFESTLLATSDLSSLYLYGLWNLYIDNQSNRGMIIDKLLSIINDTTLDNSFRIVSCYILRFLELDDNAIDRIVNVNYSDWNDAVKLQYLVTLINLYPKQDQFVLDKITDLKKFDVQKSNLSSIMMGLARKKNLDHDMDKYYQLLADSSCADFNADVLATAAYAKLLSIIN